MSLAFQDANIIEFPRLDGGIYFGFFMGPTVKPRGLASKVNLAFSSVMSICRGYSSPPHRRDPGVMIPCVAKGSGLLSILSQKLRSFRVMRMPSLDRTAIDKTRFLPMRG